MYIVAAVTCGVKIDKESEPQPLMMQMIAVARTKAAWCTKPSHRGSREIDTFASQIHSSMEEKHKGLVKTIRTRGGIAARDMAQLNEDVDDTCTYGYSE